MTSSRLLMRLCVLGMVACIAAGAAVGGRDLDDSEGLSEALQRVILSPKQAKTVVRVKRWGGLKTFTGEEEEEEEEDGREARARDTLRRQCQASCWGAWKPFQGCTVSCGSSGIQHSYRDRSVSGHCVGVINAHGCPGSNVRSRACGRSCQNGGTLRPTNCACPAGWKGTCCETRITCGFPGKPTNGAVSSGSSSHVFGARVTYSCNAGYTLQGASSNVCQGSGQWANSPPTCSRISCSRPSLNPHVSAQPSRTSYDYGSRVVFSCAEGYTRQGADGAQCAGSGAWNQPSPTCAAITCPAATAPSNGAVTTNSGNRYRSVGSFTCNSGFHLTGSSRRTCQISGQWDGTQPSCTRVGCPRLSAPGHGSVNQPGSAAQGNKATYSCASGYELRGNRERTCTYSGNSATGTWSGTTPSCSAVSCGEPTTPAHGTRTGNSFTFGSRVSFRCQAGHYLQGDETMTCQANKRWSVTSQPTCIACRVNTYKTGVNAARSCTDCPRFTHTSSAASTQREHCVCNTGYEGRDGGPCTQITCPTLVAPPNGQLGACALAYRSNCSVTCTQGYIRHGGDETRTCLLNKKWSGIAPTCKACPKNTYKSQAAKCSNCPVNSETTGTASTKTDCLCKTGFTGEPGEQCTDVNECARNNGGCQHTCVNLPGTRRCGCNTGFVKDSTDETKCVPKNACPALERPTNGGLVCVAERVVNTERCSVKCNPGFQHILQPNLYEECGPSTNFRWSTEVHGNPILGCTESFFGEIYIDGEAAYFTAACNEVTGQVRTQVQSAFLDLLRTRGVCVNTAGEATCSIDDVTIDCAPSRRKRSTSGGTNQLRINFKIKVQSRSKAQTNCSVACRATEDVVLFEDCFSDCETRIERQRIEVLQEAGNKLGGVLTSTSGPRARPGPQARPGAEELERNRGASGAAKPRPQIPQLSVAGLTLTPSGGLSLSFIRASCGEGMERQNGTCVPCPPGSYLGAGGRCVVCTPGTFQERAGQTTCLRCHGGLHSPRGATACTPIPTEEPVDFFVIIDRDPAEN